MPVATPVTHSTPPARHPLTESPEPFERLSADDMATQREEQFLAASLQAQQQAAAAHRRHPGVCASCAQRCLPLAIYCDEECKAEHERRLAIRRRQGLPG